MAKDYLGNDLEVGNKVIFMKLKYREFCKGVILKITPQTVRIDTGNNTIQQNHSQVIKEKDGEY